MHISELFSELELIDAVDAGLVSRRKHPEWDLFIYNYTPQAQYSRTWTDVTINCRGLIVDMEGEIVARPFKKFFNYGEDRVDIDLDTPVKAFDKADGSLGIIYPTPDGGVSVATRGSFESEQAIWATNHLREKNLGQDDFFNMDQLTYLCEIVYAENRIVLDYSGFEGLIGIATVEIENGFAVPALPTFAFDRYVQEFPEINTLGDALKMEPRPNAEGLVLRLEDGTNVKLKQEDYVALHRIVTGLNERTIWEALVQGNADELISSLPDEFYTWANEVKHNLTVEKMVIADSAVQIYMSVVESLPEGYTRKDFAQKAIQFENKSALFLLEDGREEEVSTWAWNQIRP